MEAEFEIISTNHRWFTRKFEFSKSCPQLNSLILHSEKRIKPLFFALIFTQHCSKCLPTMKTATSPPPKDQHKHQEHKNNFRKASATGRVRKRSTLEKSTTKPSSQSPLTIDVGNKYSPAAEDVMGTRTTNRWKPSCPPNVQIFARSLTIRKSITFAFFMIFVSCATTWYITWSGTDLGALDFDFSLSHNLSLVEKANSPNPTSKRRDQGLIIIVGSPGVGFASLEKDLTIWSKQYSIRPYSYALVRITVTVSRIFNVHCCSYLFM